MSMTIPFANYNSDGSLISDPKLTGDFIDPEVIRLKNLIDEELTRIFILGNSLEMRSFKFVPSANTAISTTDVTITLASAFIPVGSFFRVINQADSEVNIDVPVIATTSANFTVRFPFSVVGRVGATISGAAYGQDNDTGWWNYAAGLLAAQGKPVNVIRNAGDGGDTLVQMRARISTEIAPHLRPGDIVVFMGGVNGAGTGADNNLDESTAEDVVEQLDGIINDLLALGANVHAGTITQAASSAYWATSPATALANTAAANGYLRRRALSNSSRFKLFDGWTALGAGDYATAGTVETNGIHFLVAGAQLIGARYVADCGSDYSLKSFRRWLSTLDNYVDENSWNLLSNCEFTGFTGTTVGTGWALNVAGGGTRSYTLVPRTDGAGNDLLFAVTHTVATSHSIKQDITARVSAGDRLIFGTELEGGTATETAFARVRIDIVVGANTSSYRLQVNEFTYAGGGRGPTTGTRYFLEKVSADNLGRTGVVIPEGFTEVKFIYEFGLGANGTAGVIVSRPHCYKIGNSLAR